VPFSLLPGWIADFRLAAAAIRQELNSIREKLDIAAGTNSHYSRKSAPTPFHPVVAAAT
jgi:hypothetical protein